MVSGQSFAITPDTRFDFTAGPASSGVRVRVDANSTDDGTLEAQRLTILASDKKDNSTYLVGTFDGARPGIWVVSGVELGSPPGNAEPPGRERFWRSMPRNRRFARRLIVLCDPGAGPEVGKGGRHRDHSHRHSLELWLRRGES